jgi:hypothetical protein
MSEARPQAQARAQTPAGVPISSSPSPPPQSSPHPPGDLSTAPTSFVTAPPMIVSRATDSGGDGRTPEMQNKGAGHYAPPHTQGWPHRPDLILSAELLNWNMFFLSFLGAVVYSHFFWLSPPRNASVATSIGDTGLRLSELLNDLRV